MINRQIEALARQHVQILRRPAESHNSIHLKELDSLYRPVTVFRRVVERTLPFLSKQKNKATTFDEVVYELGDVAKKGTRIALEYER